MKRHILRNTVILSMLTLSMVGCGKTSPSEAIIGKWSATTDRPYHMDLSEEFFPKSMEFYSNGTLTDYSLDDAAEGTYVITDDRLKMTVNFSKLTSYTWSFDCDISGDTMKLTSDEGNTVEYSK